MYVYKVLARGGQRSFGMLRRRKIINALFPQTDQAFCFKSSCQVLFQYLKVLKAQKPKEDMHIFFVWGGVEIAVCQSFCISMKIWRMTKRNFKGNVDFLYLPRKLYKSIIKQFVINWSCVAQMFSLLMFSNDLNLYNSKYNITPHVDRLPTDKCDFADV